VDIGFQLLTLIFRKVVKADVELNSSFHRRETSKFLQEPGEVPADWGHESWKGLGRGLPACTSHTSGPLLRALACGLKAIQSEKK